MVVIGKSLLIFSEVTFKMPPGGHIGFFGFQTLTVVWLWISTPNLSGTILMYMCRSLMIFSNVNFKMAARQPYWNFWFPDSNFSLALNINSKLQWQSTYVYGYRAYWFSVTSFSKWLPAGHITSRFFGFWMHGFGSVTQVCFGISVSNFMCMSFVAIGRSLTIVSYVAFKMAALWFLTMPPSPMGRGYPSRSLIYNF